MFHQSGGQARNSGGDREIVVLRDVEELSSGVTAKRLNATKPVVKIRLFRAGANELRRCVVVMGPTSMRRRKGTGRTR